MKLLISTSTIAPNRDPEMILRRIANTIDPQRSRHPGQGDYSHPASTACWSRVGQYLRDAAPQMKNLKLSDRIFLYGSEIDLDPGEVAHVCLYAEDGHMRADTMALRGGKPMRTGNPGAYQRFYFIPPSAQPQTEKRSPMNYMLIRAISVDNFFREYFTEAPFRLGIQHG